jgi:hypothetical protein
MCYGIYARPKANNISLLLLTSEFLMCYGIYARPKANNISLLPLTRVSNVLWGFRSRNSEVNGNKLILLALGLETQRLEFPDLKPIISVYYR